MIKNQLGTEGIYLNNTLIYMRQTYRQPHAKCKETQIISTKVKNKTRGSTLSIPIQYHVCHLNWNNKKIKGTQREEEEIQESLFAEGVIVYTKVPKNVRKNQTEATLRRASILSRG